MPGKSDAQRERERRTVEGYYEPDRVDDAIDRRDATIATLRERLAKYSDPLSQLGPNSHLRLWEVVGSLMSEKDITLIGHTLEHREDFRVTFRDGRIYHGQSLTEALERSGAIVFECEAAECQFRGQPDGRQIREQKAHVMQGGRHYHLACEPPPG